MPEINLLKTHVIDLIKDITLLPDGVALALLALLSILSWAIIIGKATYLNRIRRIELTFAQRLRESGSCLEVYEERICFRPSPQFEVYHHGARASATEMVGSGSPALLSEHRLETYGTLSARQMECVEQKMEFGEKLAASQLRKGFGKLTFITIAASAVGLGTAITLSLIAEAGGGNGFETMLDRSIILIAASCLVAVPAGFARMILIKRCRRVALQTRDFRTRLAESFARYLVESEEPEEEPVKAEKPKPTKEKPRFYSLTRGCLQPV